MALRMRDKQRQVRELLNERRQAQEALEKANQSLQTQANELAAVNEQLLTEREELQRQSLELNQLKEQAEKTARAMESLFRSVEENPDPVLRVSVDGAIQYRNPASFPLSREWNAGDKHRVPPAVQEIVSAAYGGTRIIRREMTFGERTYLLTVAPAPSLARYVHLFASDITEPKRAEEALRESERRLALALSGTQVGMYDQDIASGEIRGTDQVARLLGLRTTTTLSQLYHYHDWAGRVHPEDLPRVEADLQRCQADHSPCETEYRVLPPDGRVRWVVDRGVFQYDPDGRPTHRLGIVMDVTERKRAEGALRESEERLHLALGAARMGVWQWEVGTQHVAWSPELYGLLGYEPGQVTPTHEAFRQRIHPQDLARWEQAIRESMERCENYSCEFRVVWADGSVHWVEARGQYAYPADESTTQAVWMRGIMSDIEQRKRAEEALRESQEQFRMMANAIPQLAWIARADGYIYWYNQRWYEYTGTTPEQMEGWGWQSVHDPQELPKVLERWKYSIVTGQPFDRTFPLRGADGAFRPFLTRVMPLKDEQGRVRQWFGTNTDVSEQKRAEESLRETRDYLDSLFGYANAPIIVWDREFKITRFNHAFERLTGRPAHEVLGRDIDILFPPDSREESLARIRATTEGQRWEVVEIPILGVEGEVRTVLWNSANVLASDRKTVVATIAQGQDITERKRAAEALHELNATLEGRVAQRTAELKHRTRQLQKLAFEMSEAEDRERERLAQILHDDLQQELAAAKFHLSIVRSRVKSDASIQEVTAKVDEMLKDAIAKSRSLSHELRPAVLHQDDFAEILRWLANEMQAKHGLRVQVQGQAHCSSDPIRAFLYRTAQELLFNAVKHAHVAEARVRVRQRRGYLCLTVSDRGLGFDPSQLRETAGFGLLSVRERIELLGGRMRIRSAPGQGSTLFVVVPDSSAVGVGPRAYPTRGSHEDKEGGHGGSPLRVLLADDHQVVRQGLVSLLSEDETIQVVGEATNGQEAVELTDRLHPDVVVMDVLMPVMSGEEATRRIKQDLPQIRIVSLSMREEPEVRERMCKAGAESYVLKTAPYKELLAAIRGKESDS